MIARGIKRRDGEKGVQYPLFIQLHHHSSFLGFKGKGDLFLIGLQLAYRNTR